MFNIQAIAASVRKRFYDNFAGRSNTTGSLGTATDGSVWDAVNGTLQVTSGAATATTVPSVGGAGNTYPMATVNMPTSNNVIKIGGATDGAAAAIWVQSGSDWWMVDVEADQTVTANYSYAYDYYSYSAYTWATTQYGPFYSQGSTFVNGYTTSSSLTALGGYNTTTTKTGTKVTTRYGTVNSYSAAWAFTPYTSSIPGSFSYTAGPTTTSTYTYGYVSSAIYGYTYLSSYTTIKNEYLKIKQAVSNTVSVISSQLVSTSQSIASFLVSIVGNVITAKAYSDSNFVTQIGSDLVYTATGATITTKYGISLSPSVNYGGSTIGTSVDITRG
jgi:hypothetical protein